MRWGLIAVIVLFVGIGTHDLATKNDHSKPSEPRHAAASSRQVRVASSGISYPASWQEAKLISLSSEQIGVISEAARTDPAVSLSVREVKGVLTKDFNIQDLPSEVVTSLEHGVDGFSLSHQGLIKIGTYQAVNIGYMAFDSNHVKYANDMFIVPTPQKTFYITYHGSEEDLSKVGADISQINLSVSQLQ